MYTIGIDFGTESGRAVAGRLADGREIATAVHPYGDGVIDERLPGRRAALPPDWALQDPDDYLAVFEATVPAVLRAERRRPADVIGIGIDFTACTMLPTHAPTARRCASCPSCASNPHAWVKLWKHHAAQPEADRINAPAREHGRAVAGALRRQDLVASGSSPRPCRSSTRRPRSTTAADALHRGRRLGRLAADRRRDPQRLHRRLQGDVAGRTASRAARLLRRAPPGLRATSSTTSCAATSLPLGARGRRADRRGGRWTGPAARHRRRRRQRRRPRRRPRHAAVEPGHDGR